MTEAPQRRGRGATFAGFTEKIREKISAAPPAPLSLGDPNVRSELAKEYQPEKVELEKGEWFDEVKHDGKLVQLKMTKAGIAMVDPTTKAVGETYEWQYIADFRVGKNKKTFAIMHDTNKDGSKLARVEFKSKETMRMLGTATKFVDVLAAEMREKAAAAAESAAKPAEEHKKKGTKKKAAKKSGLGQHSHSPRGDGEDDDEAKADASGSGEAAPKKKVGKKKDAADSDNETNDKDPADDEGDDKKPRRQRRGTRRKDEIKDDADKADADADDGAAAPAADADGEEGAAKPRRQRRGTRSKVTEEGGDEPLIEKEKKKKARSRAQTAM